MEQFPIAENLKKDEPENPSRRGFLKKAGAVVAAAGAMKLSYEAGERRERKNEEEEEKKQERWDDIKESVEKLKTRFGLQAKEAALVVNPETQELYVVRDDQILKTYLISTGKAGLGGEAGTKKTPLGTHRIKEKVGQGAKKGIIFQGRQSTGKKAVILKEKIDIPENLVTTRILWLEGQEPGINKGKNVDSYKRFIYIHGTPEEGLLGEPASDGCIRMSNDDVVELFDLIPTETLVEIQKKAFIKKN